MADKIILVTDPDDILSDGFRILLVDLTEIQAAIFTSALTKLDTDKDIIVYVWKFGNDIRWVIDKKLKSSMILFNANSDNQTLIGYMAAQNNSYYFGELRDIKIVNNNVIFDQNDCKDILEKKDI